jgi:SAM-dependent methyltransferase
MAGVGERITAATPEGDRCGHEFRYRLAAGFCHPGDVVLDAACGAGYGAVLLRAGRVIRYIGVDRDLCDVPAGNPSLNFREADLESWEPDFDFDVFVGFETIEHLEDCSAYVRAAKQARRWIAISCPVIPTVGQNPYHRRDFEPGELPSLFVGDEWELYQAVPQPSELAEIYSFRRRA